MATQRREHPESDLPNGLSKPAQRALAAAGYRRLEQLAKLSEAELLQLHGVGPKALDVLRPALRAKGLSFGAKTKRVIRRAATPVRYTERVNEFMDQLDHPFKAEVQAVRTIILNANKHITEQIKWAAPSFSYKGYLATFNLWNKKCVHLIFHKGAILNHASGLLEGDYPDRRMVYFSNMKDVKAKQAALEKAVREWVRLMDNS